jgi:hypothetical protein
VQHNEQALHLVQRLDVFVAHPRPVQKIDVAIFQNLRHSKTLPRFEPCNGHPAGAWLNDLAAQCGRHTAAGVDGRRGEPAPITVTPDRAVT